MGYAARDDRDTARSQGLLVTGDVQPHLALQHVERLVRIGVLVQRGHLARVQRVLEEQVRTTRLETADPALRGTMTMTTTLTEADGGTDIVVVHEGIPDSVPAADNEMGTRMALANLAKFVEANRRPGDQA